PIAGLVHPPMSGTAGFSSLPDARSITRLGDGSFLISTGFAGRLVQLKTSSPVTTSIVGGYSEVFASAAPANPLDLATLYIAEASGTAADEAGNLYFSDATRGLVYKVSGVTTGEPGSWDLAPLDTQSEEPAGLLAVSDRELWIADRARHCIVAYDVLTSQHSVIAGICGIRGHQDGPANQVLFNGPTHLYRDERGTLYIADSLNRRVRALHNGQVHTILGNGQPAMLQTNQAAVSTAIGKPGALAVDRFGNLFVAAEEVVWEVANANSDFTLTGMEPAFPIFDATSLPSTESPLKCLEAMHLLADRESLLVVDGCTGKGFELHGVQR
ncbi:MAG: hypothetical protein ACO3JL_19255, partial [Myxococcota bacterium]